MPVTQPVVNFNFVVSMWQTAGPQLFGSSVASGLVSAAVNLASQFVFGGFSEVTGLNSEVEIESYNEGGRNDQPHKFFKYARFPNLTFKRGVTFNTDLADWYAQVIGGNAQPIIRKDGLILLMDRGGLNSGPVLGGLTKLPVAAWKFTSAIPERLVGPNLNAKGNEVAIETLELSHRGLQRVSLSMIPGLGDLAGGAVSSVLSSF